MSIISNMKRNSAQIIEFLELIFNSFERVMFINTFPYDDKMIMKSIFPIYLHSYRFLYAKPYNQGLHVDPHQQVKVRGFVDMLFDSTSGRCTNILFILDSGDKYELSYETMKFFDEYLSSYFKKDFKKEIKPSPDVMNDFQNLNIFLQNAYDNNMQSSSLQIRPSQQQYFYSDPKGPMVTMSPMGPVDKTWMQKFFG